ncbi:hypothetical protein DYH56_06880 [Psychrilyobacter piezotolerans]|uniref:Uncharacterized protein n=1 Tax=Psychrilyobacter piezotolerans TaxID=2293438 RepID=A0ABX9KHT3_9FUSO|nr:hypothetical protein DV867_06880 [Psychrilyobacter sp. S5]REI41385.1 hypothetical protein DYH56_06880 [Psychrilyobacter piezotolerans]
MRIIKLNVSNREIDHLNLVDIVLVELILIYPSHLPSPQDGGGGGYLFGKLDSKKTSRSFQFLGEFSLLFL